MSTYFIRIIVGAVCAVIGIVLIIHSRKRNQKENLTDRSMMVEMGIGFVLIAVGLTVAIPHVSQMGF